MDETGDWMTLVIDPRAFPAAPPADPTDPRVISAHDWDAFARVDAMVNHWDRPGWTDTTRAYYWMLTFPDAQALISQARHCQQELRHLGFDEIDEDGFSTSHSAASDSSTRSAPTSWSAWSLTHSSGPSRPSHFRQFH
jgi:hypothetical protein